MTTGDDDTAAGEQGRTLKSLERSFAIVTELKERGSAGVTELAEATGLSKSSVHKHLATLHAGDFVTKEGSQYALGLRFLDLGGHARNTVQGNTLILEKLRTLVEESGETAQFTVEENGRAVVLYRETGTHGVFSKGRVGKRFYLHQPAAGKAMLAQMDPETVQDIVDTHGLPTTTEQTITDSEALFDELDTIRERGYALNRGETTKGLRAVAVPVMFPEDEILGAFAIAGPSHRLKDDRLETEIPELLNRVVNELELNLAHS